MVLLNKKEVLDMTAIQVKEKVRTYFTTDNPYPKSDHFSRFLQGLCKAASEGEDDKLWESDTVFIMEYEASGMSPNIKSGAVIWVDTTQVPIINRGVIDGALYLIKSGITTIPVADYVRKVQVFFRDGTWGRLYWDDWTEARGAERKFIPLRTKKDHIKDNSRYIGKVVGVVNPL